MLLADLRKQAQALALAIAQVKAASLGGEALLSRERTFAPFEDLLATERYQQVRELAADSSGNRAIRLTRLADFLAVMHSERNAANALDQRDFQQRKRELTHPVGGDPLSLPEALIAIPEIPSSEGRQRLESQISQTLHNNAGLTVACHEADAQAAEALGMKSARALRQLRGSSASAQLRQFCQEFLNDSEGMYRDLLSWRLRKAGAPRAYPHGAQRHDLLFAASPHEYDAFFLHPPRRFEEALLPMGVHPRAQGRIIIDSETNPFRHPGALALATNPPFELLISHRAKGGFQDSWQRLHSLGIALHLANTNPQRPFEDRLLGDTGVDEGFGTLFANLLFDPEWLSRHLGARAPDLVRILAFTHLFHARLFAAQLLAQEAVEELGPGSQAQKQYAELLSSQLLGQWPEAHFWSPLFSPRSPATALRGFALEALLHQSLRSHFDEDWWRNPRSGAWLQKLHEAGRFFNAEELGSRLLGPEFGEGEKKNEKAGEIEASVRNLPELRASGDALGDNKGPSLVQQMQAGLRSEYLAKASGSGQPYPPSAALRSTTENNPQPAEDRHSADQKSKAAFDALLRRLESLLD